MDVVAVGAVIAFAASMAVLARLTGHALVGPFAFVLRHMPLADPAPWCRAIGRMLYTVAAVLLGLGLALALFPEAARTLTTLAGVLVGVLPAMAGFAPARRAT